MSRVKGKVFDVLFIGALVVAALALAASDTPRAVAQEDGASNSEPSPSESPPREPFTPHNPFKPYAKDPGYWHYDDLSDGEKRRMDRAAEWAEADQGYDLHQAYRGASRFGVAFARKKKAERESGLQGIGDVGVE